MQLPTISVESLYNPSTIPVQSVSSTILSVSCNCQQSPPGSELTCHKTSTHMQFQKCTQRVALPRFIALEIDMLLRLSYLYLERGRKWAFQGLKVSDLPLFTPQDGCKKSRRLLSSAPDHDGSVRICAKSLHALMLVCQKIIRPRRALRTLRFNSTFVSNNTFGVFCWQNGDDDSDCNVSKRREAFHIGDFKPWHVAQGTR